MKKGFIFILLFLALAAQAQFPSGRTFHYTRKDGLSYYTVNSILQDDKGFMWFATGDGLNRFDGQNFEVFKHEGDNKLSLPGNYVQQIFKDAAGTFWVTSRKGLYQFNTKSQQFNQFPLQGHISTGDVSHISENRKHNLWISTSSNGFFYLNRASGKITRFTKENLKGLGSNSVLKIYEDAYGLLWVGTKDSGVFVFRIHSEAVLEALVLHTGLSNSSRVNAIYQDHAQNIWMATSAGLWLYERKGAKVYQLQGSNYGLRSNRFLSLIEDSKKQLYVGLQDGGLYKIDLSKFNSDRPQNVVFDQLKSADGYNLTPRSVLSLFLDKEENLWAGTYGDGILMVSRTADKFRALHRKLKNSDGENYLRYYGMCTDEEGMLWLGTDGDGIYKTTPEGNILKHYSADGKSGSLTDNAILYAYRDSKNNLWFGTYSKGLFLYNRKSDSFTNFQHQPGVPGSLGGNDVRVIHEDSQHQIWIGTNGGGLNLYQPESRSFKVYNNSNSKISANDIRSLAHDEKGNIWVGTYGAGLNYFNVREQQFHPFQQTARFGADFSADIVFSLYYDHQNRLWIGTENNGLLVYQGQGKTTQRFNEKNGLANNSVYAIQEESPGKVWLSTNDGISKVELAAAKVYNYGTKDGLQGGQFNPGSVTSVNNAEMICFGGTEGWNIFYPKMIRQSRREPITRITGLQLYGKAEHDAGDTRNITDSTSIVLDAAEQVFSIQYVALNYAYPKAAEFAYQMEGLDKDWNYVKNQKSATYRYLQPGSYTFKVRATNQDGVWQQHYAKLHIEILPPWYKTWWAYLGYMLLTAAVIYLLIRYKLNQDNLRYKIRIAGIEAQKEKELHENKLSFFTNISHEFRSPLTLIINPVREILDERNSEKDLSSLHIVFRNARRLLSLVDQLLLFSKADTKDDKLKLMPLNLHQLCEEVFLCFTYQAAKKRISYQFDSGSAEIEIIGDREKIEIALFNLISNALRHTPDGGAVSLSLAETAEHVQIKVADTGSGIAADIGEKIFDRFYKVQQNKNYAKGGFGIGLYLVKSFMDSHYGKVSYKSMPDQGTVFELSLRKGREHFKGEHIFEASTEPSLLLEELAEGVPEPSALPEPLPVRSITDEISSEQQTILVIDDNQQIRNYIRQIFSPKFQLLEAEDGEEGLKLVRMYLPDIVISDVVMPTLNGVELCRLIKEDPSLNHIPVVLLTASTASDVKLKGISYGADDYIGKPFDKDLLIARIEGLLKSRNDLQKYFFNEVTLKSGNLKISAEYKEFLDRCMEIVEHHMADPNFGIQTLAEEIGMSRSNLYIRIKSVSGQSANGFIRFIRLRKAAELFASTDLTVQETSFIVGIKDARYFREQFYKLFQMNPSDYIRKYRQTFNGKFALNKDLVRSKASK
jgi:ligand-binding sensor domain-containing protein/signal transduction histidine kinase/DNA-binding NarL/FixJ family response regulator